MPVRAANAIDFVTARAHGCYSRRASPACLDRLALLGTVRDLVRGAGGSAEADSCAAFQTWLARDLTRELWRLAQAMEGPPATFLEWLAQSTRVEDLKTLVRAGNAAPTDERLRAHLIHGSGTNDSASCPSAPGFPGSSRAARRTSDFALPPTPGGRTRAEEGPSPPVRQELALDRAYLVELLARSRRLGGGAQETVLPLVWQQIDLFHLRVALGVVPVPTGPDADAWRAGLHIPGAAIGRPEFLALLKAGDARVPDGRGLRRVVGSVAGEPPAPPSAAAGPDAGELERRAWRRLRQLACRAFRRDPMGLGALAGYVVLRWIAAADLGRLAEGVRLGLTPVERRAGLLHVRNPEDPRA